MTQSEIARWIREEHVKVAELSAKLHEKVAVVPRAHQERWVADLLTEFGRFRAHIVKHMALEEDGGYMTGVLAERPSLSGEVTRLAREHQQLARMMADIARLLEEIKPDDHLLLRETCRRIRSLLGYLEHHEKDENLLVVSAFTDDLGTED
jgi:hemerythrin-like domain-containing protein